jgi:D-hydroxyproline dehydrogenase subunit beta
MHRILIIGAGLVGASLAFRLARTGAEVTVLDAAQPAAAATGASFGWINASFFHSPAHYNLRAAAIAAHHRLDRDLGETGTLWSGCLWWEKDGAALDTQGQALSDLGYTVHDLDARQIAAREPALAPPKRCLFFPDEGAVDAARLTHRLLAASGVRVRADTAVTAIETDGGRAVAVRTAQGALTADHIILAAGTACPTLLAPLGLTLPMLRGPGLILQTRPVGVRLNHILASPAQEVRQDRGNRLIAPLAAAHQGDGAEDVHTPPGDLAEAALARLRALLPGVGIEPETIGFAFRPVPGDGMPAVGATGLAGLSLAVMHSGVTLAPLVAELLTAEITEGTASPILAEFCPTRFF